LRIGRTREVHGSVDAGGASPKTVRQTDCKEIAAAQSEN
jgi:hypothetical protein